MAEPGPPDRTTQSPGPPAPVRGGEASTVTHGFMFADLRGYTRYVDAHGDHAAAELLSRYRTLVRGAVANFRGAEIKTEGDSFYVVFDSASAAVRCGLAIVDAAAATTDGPADAIQVGVGVHAGETVETAEGYVGSAVNIAARLCAQAKAGELVVSETVRSLTRTYLDVEFEPLGTRRLKGLDEPIAIDRVTTRGSARSRGMRSRRARDQRRWWLAGVGGVALVAVLAVAGAAVLQGARPSPTAVPSAAASVAPSPASTTSGTPPTAAPSAGAGGLMADELALMARIPQDFQRFCVRSSLPGGSLGGDVASFKCELPVGTEAIYGADTVWYDAFGSPGVMAAAVNTVVNTRGLPVVEGRDMTTADCTSGEGKAVGTWRLGITFSGVAACYPKEGVAWMLWTYTGQLIAARAVRNDGDAARLYDWWHQTSGYLQ